MERASQLVLRHAAALSDGPVLLFNPPRDALYRELAAARPVRVFSQDYGDYAWLRDSGADAGFGVLPWLPDPAEHDVASDAGPALSENEPGIAPSAGGATILFLPREKERLDLLLHALAAPPNATATLWLVGENRAGIKSAGKRLAARFGHIEPRDNARHCGLYRATSPRAAPFRLDDYRQQWDLPLPIGLGGSTLRIASLPGVFAHGRLDGGTALLLEFLAGHFRRLRIGGNVLDFGCGAGVLALALLRANPDLRVSLLDTSAVALASARWSLQANGVPAGAVEWIAADGLPAAGPAYDWIVSNPPFHRGVDTDTDIARRFFARAAMRLAKGGKLLLVCNRHLPYERALAEHFGALENVAADRDFKVLLAARDAG